MTDRLHRVVVVGAGSMGQQIAAHCLICGKDTRLYDIRPRSGLHPHLTDHIVRLSDDPVEQERRRRLLEEVTVSTDAAAAADGVDLLIECIPENMAAKRQVLHRFSRLCPPGTVFTTNTSTFLPSAMLRAVPQPERFAAMHFFPYATAGELMGHEATAPDTLEALRLFLEDIGHTVIVCDRESPGALFNAMLIPWLGAALSLAAEGIAAPAEADRAWKLVTGARQGPFEVMDMIGLDTVLGIVRSLQGTSERPELKRQRDLLQSCVNEGRLGLKNGCGFYRYDRPAPPSSPAPALWPLFSSVRPADDGTVVMDLSLDGTRDAFLKDHSFKGAPFLPGAAMIELFCQAVARVSGQPATVLQDVRFVNGLRCFRNVPEQAVLRVRPDGTRWHVELRHVFCNRNGRVMDPDRLCAAATVVTDHSPAPDSSVCLPASSSWHRIEYLTGHTVELGPSMQCLRRLTLSDSPFGAADILSGYQEVDDPARVPAAGHRAVSLTDAAFVACNSATQYRLNDALQLPTAITAIRRGPVPPPGTLCRMHYECVHTDETTAEYRFTVTADGRPVLSVDGYRCHVVRGDSISRLIPE